MLSLPGVRTEGVVNACVTVTGRMANKKRCGQVLRWRGSGFIGRGSKTAQVFVTRVTNRLCGYVCVRARASANGVENLRSKSKKKLRRRRRTNGKCKAECIVWPARAIRGRCQDLGSPIPARRAPKQTAWHGMARSEQESARGRATDGIHMPPFAPAVHPCLDFWSDFGPQKTPPTNEAHA